MKKIIEVGIGKVNFEMEEDAYYILKDYLFRFERSITSSEIRKEVMEDVEARVAEMFHNEKKYPEEVITLKFVDMVIECLGDIPYKSENSKDNLYGTNESDSSKKFYRDPDDKKIAGVCSGIAAYFSIDVTLVRILFLIVLLCFGTTFWIYIIIWSVSQQAYTVSRKLQMRGIPVTAENILKYKKEIYGNY